MAHCNDDINETLVCKMKVATSPEHCDNKMYNPEAADVVDALPLNKTTVLNETTHCTIQTKCAGPNNTVCSNEAICLKEQCAFESLCKNSTNETTGLLDI